MGRVYAAIAPDGERVALKLVKLSLAGDATYRRRFEREARLASQVTHPRVVSVVDSGLHQGIPYLVQPFIVGRSLDELIDQEGPLDTEAAVRVSLQVGEALEAIHAEGITHRDLKPANVMLDEQGDVHITDFGLARHREGSLLTMPGQTVGSMDYMAPEQIRGETIGAAADVYAFGCLMVCCVSGRPPFADRKGVKVLWAHLQDGHPTPAPNGTTFPPASTRRSCARSPRNPSRGRKARPSMPAASRMPPEIPRTEAEMQLGMIGLAAWGPTWSGD